MYRLNEEAARRWFLNPQSRFKNGARTAKGPNTFSQTIKDLEPGRLYSMKMFSCDYEDLVNPKAKKLEEATKFIGSIVLEDVELDGKRSFSEMA